MKRSLLRLHRWLGLAMLAFWMLQAVTGSLLAFRWEIEDAMLPGTAAAANFPALGARVEAIEAGGGHVDDLWATADAATRFDVYYFDASGAARIMRVDGDGQVLRDASDAGSFSNGAVFDTLTELHTKLLAGEIGSWLVAASGLLLFTNLTIGIRLAWPRTGSWVRALLPASAISGAPRLFSWHRSLGLWLGLLILPFVAAGVLLCFEHGLREILEGEVPEPAFAPDSGSALISPAEALEVARARYPDSRLSVLVLPDDGKPWYRVRRRRPGDLRRNWGMSTLFVSASDGRILSDHPSTGAPTGRRFVDTIYPFHTGQLAGVAGRALVLLQSIWLIAMIVLGLRLWRTRHTC